MNIIKEKILSLITRGILTITNVDDLVEGNLSFEILKTMLTLIADMTSLHVYDGDALYDLLGFLEDGVDGTHGQNIQDVCFKCLCEVENAETDHPVKGLLNKMTINAKSEKNIALMIKLFKYLVKKQKDLNMPWLYSLLGDLFSSDEEINQELKDYISQSLVRLSGD